MSFGIDSLRTLAHHYRLDRYISWRLVLLIDVFASVCSTLMAVFLADVLSGVHIHPEVYAILLTLSFVSSLLSFYLWKTYRNTIRHTTLKDTWKLGVAVITKMTVMGWGVLLWGGLLTKRQLQIGFTIDLLLTVIALFAVRVAMLVAYDIITSRSQVESKQKNILIYGAGDYSVALANRLNNKSDPSYTLTGFLTFGVRYKSLRVAGHPVYYFRNEADFHHLVARYSINSVLLPDYRSAQKEKDRLIRYCERSCVKVLIAPPVDEIRDGKVMKQRVREVLIEDLLGREEIRINLDQITANFRDKTVLVTGAAGSIGSELCRQLAGFGIRKLILFDSAETPVHNLRLEMEERFPELSFVPIVGDVRIKTRLDHIFREYRPAVVFHAAAYKHVPLMEENPCEAVFVNVFGTRNVADLCVDYDVEKMVMISTDKAVNPTNVMGASKRLAEIYVQSLGLAIAGGEHKGRTQFITTRFGNVLGSNGSVIPRFREQIERGGPVTVTHPEITRFFMTIPEACRLVMEAATMGAGHEIFVFEMGEPMRIADLAMRMIELAGFRPDIDIKIAYTGLRPGEKLYEELLSTEEYTLPTSHQKIRIAKVRSYPYGEICEQVSRLSKLSMRMLTPQTVCLMKQIVPEFKSNNSLFEKWDEKLASSNLDMDMK